MKQLQHSVQTTVKSRCSDYQKRIEFLVVSKITEQTPVNQINLETLNIPPAIALVDPQFHIPNKADIPIGAEIFWDLVCADQYISEQKQPKLQKTKLGWIAAGVVDDGSSQQLLVTSVLWTT